MGLGYYRTIKTRKLIALLVRQGFVSVGGSKHGKYIHQESNKILIVPRHRKITQGTAREICKSLEKEYKISREEIIKIF